MPSSAISNLTAVTTPALTDTYVTVQSGTDLKITATQMATLMPGYQLNYVEFTSSVNVTATTEGTADTVVAGSSVTYDGSTAVMIEFFCAQNRVPASAGAVYTFILLEDSTVLGQIANIKTPSATANFDVPVFVCRKRTPSAGAHTYTIKAFVSTGTGISAAGSGGSGNLVPGFIRVTRA